VETGGAQKPAMSSPTYRVRAKYQLPTDSRRCLPKIKIMQKLATIIATVPGFRPPGQFALGLYDQLRMALKVSASIS
jgi:hypothetical protein